MARPLPLPPSPALDDLLSKCAMPLLQLAFNALGLRAFGALHPSYCQIVPLDEQDIREVGEVGKLPLFGNEFPLFHDPELVDFEAFLSCRLELREKK